MIYYLNKKYWNRARTINMNIRKYEYKDEYKNYEYEYRTINIQIFI